MVSVISVVGELPPGREPDAARVAAAAFVDDPYWLSLSPLPRAWRRALITDVTRADLRRGRQTGDYPLVAQAGAEIVGLAHVAEERAHTVPVRPPRAILGTGPWGIWRWRQAEARLAALLPTTPHDYLYTIAVAPDHQGSGHGRALLEQVITRAQGRGLPLALDTMKPENLTFYARFGFEVIGRYPLSRGYQAWAMLRSR